MNDLNRQQLMPRALYLSEPWSAEAERPVMFDPLAAGALPPWLTELTGSILSARPLKTGGPTPVFLLTAQRGEFVLKAAACAYRAQELEAEHLAMRLASPNVTAAPVPLLLARHGSLSLLLRHFVRGEPLTKLPEDTVARREAILEAGRLLAEVHSAPLDLDWSWEEWIEASLKLAEINLKAGAWDPDEFNEGRSPEEVFAWLKDNRPSRPGGVCLLHGDFRPKNILFSGGRVTGLIDWQFVDVGDPLYDLSVFDWYLKDDEERRLFLEGYGIEDVDRERFEFCLNLQKFINV